MQKRAVKQVICLFFLSINVGSLHAADDQQVEPSKMHSLVKTVGVTLCTLASYTESVLEEATWQLQRKSEQEKARLRLRGQLIEVFRSDDNLAGLILLRMQGVDVAGVELPDVTLMRNIFIPHLQKPIVVMLEELSKRRDEGVYTENVTNLLVFAASIDEQTEDEQKRLFEEREQEAREKAKKKAEQDYQIIAAGLRSAPKNIHVAHAHDYFLNDPKPLQDLAGSMHELLPKELMMMALRYSSDHTQELDTSGIIWKKQ